MPTFTNVALVFSSLAFAACVGDAAVNTTPDSGGNDASTPDGGGNDSSVIDGGGGGPTGTFANAVVFNDISIGSAATVASSGEVVLVGSFTGTLNINNLGYTSLGNTDIFVVKLAPNNGVMWVKVFGGSGSDDANAVAIDASGNIYVAGAVSTAVAFGGKNVPSVHAGFTSYVVKLDATGTAQWATSFDQTAGGFNTQCTSLAVGPAPSIGVGCITGGNLQYPKSDTTTGTRTHGSGTLGDVWLAELDPAAGGVMWGALLTGAAAGSDVVSSVAFDATNNFYAGGTTPSPVMTSDTPTFTVTKKSLGSQPSNTDAWLVKLAPGAIRVFAWAQTYGAGSDMTAGAVAAVAPDGTLFFSGSFNGGRDFGKGLLTASGALDGFLLHLEPVGGSTLAQTIFGGPSNNSNALGMDVDDKGNPIVVASYSGSGYVLGAANLPATASPQNLNAFVAKYPPSLAAPLYVKPSLATAADGGSNIGVRPTSIAVNRTSGQSVTAGSLGATVDLGDGKLVMRSNAAFVLRRDR